MRSFQLLTTLAFCLGATFAPTIASAGERADTRIVGSSTVAPFATLVANEIKAKSGRILDVESTGTGGGFKLFCAGPESQLPQITNASRAILTKEIDACSLNEVEDIIEVKFGFDGIVVAAARGTQINLTLQDLFLAFAADIPRGEGKAEFGTGDCTMILNDNKKWSDVRPDLPHMPIEAYGPPPTSGTRDAFMELAIEAGANTYPCIAGLKAKDEKAYKKTITTLRSDGAWVNAGENDNAIVQVLTRKPGTVGIFGYSFLSENADRIQPASISSVTPSFESIAAGKYPLSRPLFFYVKDKKGPFEPAISAYIGEFLSARAISPGGYLSAHGLITLPKPAEKTCVEHLKIDCDHCVCRKI